MAEIALPSPDDLRNALVYNPEDGSLTWKERDHSHFKDDRTARSWNTRLANRPAFTTTEGAGYKAGHIFRAHVLAHRVAWAIHTGEWPSGHVDHINGDRLDNRIVNLRIVTRQENQRNTRLPRSNTSGIIGVYWCKHKRKWRAAIGCDGRTVCLGRFNSKEEAIAARREAEVSYGFHKNHGRR